MATTEFGSPPSPTVASALSALPSGAVSDWATIIAGVGGAAIGAAFGYLGSARLRKKEWARSDRAQQQAELRRLYMRFLEATDRLADAGWESSQRGERGDMADEVRKAAAAAHDLFSEIEVAGDKAVIEAADELHSAALGLMDAPGVSYRQDWHLAREEYKRAVRQSFSP
jgi:hypothetical protein